MTESFRYCGFSDSNINDYCMIDIEIGGTFPLCCLLYFDMGMYDEVDCGACLYIGLD